MGRYTQANRKGSPVPPPLVLRPVTITYIVADLASYAIGFSHGVIVNLGNPNEGALVIDGDIVTPISQPSPNVVEITAGAGYAPDLTWDLYRQPPWLITPIAGPQSGMTT